MEDFTINNISCCDLKIGYIDDEVIEVNSTVPENHQHMDGHFDSFKILPAVTQIGMVLDILSYHHQKKISFKGIKKTKFRGMIRPHDRITLQVRVQQNEAAWTLISGEKLYSKGTIAYEF